MSEEGALITMEASLDATNALILKTLTAPNVVDLPRGHVSPPDLPLQPVHNQAKLGHVFDMVGIVNFDVDLKAQITRAAKEGRFHDMPEPFCLKVSPEMSYGMQLYVLSTSDGQHFLVKHIFLSDRVKGELGSSLCYGEPRMLDWHGNAKNLKKSVQYMLEKMGGFQVQSFILQASVGSAGGEAKARSSRG